MGRNTIHDLYGPGTFTDAEFIPLTQDCRRLLKYFAEVTPGFTKDSAVLEAVDFHGRDLPILPGPIKAQALVRTPSGLHVKSLSAAQSAVFQAMIGILGREISLTKGVDPGRVSIDIDKSGLYPATPALVSIDGKSLIDIQQDGSLSNIGLNVDRGVINKNAMYVRSWAIYPTKDQHVWYQVMGNLHVPEFLNAYGLDSENHTASRDEAYEIIKAEMVKYSAAELELNNMEHGFCGQTCYTPAKWRTTDMGRSLGKHPVINCKRVCESQSLPPIPFPVLEDKRPLAGIRVVELARVIAVPALGAALASLGADVIKVQSPNLRDLQVCWPCRITRIVEVLKELHAAFGCDIDRRQAYLGA
jgi:hypothetical protein